MPIKSQKFSDLTEQEIKKFLQENGDRLFVQVHLLLFEEFYENVDDLPTVPVGVTLSKRDKEEKRLWGRRAWMNKYFS